MQLKNEKSLENAFSIKLKNYARNVQKKQLLQKANQKSLLEKRLTVMLGNQIRFRKQKEQRQEKLKRMHMNLTPER
jgi:DNA-binding helix-hairpin-helix protein with protein kinase domain